ncbi:hypothetical protein FORC065_4463 [Yersinia enterocolitica]|nr:hypothetical protein FORC065_4463 [Yersinia enterocolitica]
MLSNVIATLPNGRYLLVLMLFLIGLSIPVIGYRQYLRYKKIKISLREGIKNLCQ